MPTATENIVTEAAASEEILTATESQTVTERPKIKLPHDYADDEHYYIESVTVKKKPIFAFFKRCIDIFASLIALILCAIPMLIIAIIIKASDGGPVFYSQERLGYKGKKFNLVKFRSMKVDAEKYGAQWSDGDNDPRITKIGRFLRKTRLDEIPQFWACFTGKMSLVGPRPEREIFYNEFEKHIHGFSERLKVKPGFTGLAQVSGGYDLFPEEKVVYDVEYIKKRSLWLDIKILFKTVFVIFSHKGAK
ncbi:MAG: sugar transferase [Clostridia bacterium]|nr:sugar transferase [Clostridia bacterium]